MGASTWALGSHKWREYRGIFTRKAMIRSVHHMCGSTFVGGVILIENMFNWLFWLRSKSKLSSSGRLAEMVYIII